MTVDTRERRAIKEVSGMSRNIGPTCRTLSGIALTLALALPGSLPAAMADADLDVVRQGSAHRALFGVDFSDDGSQGLAVGDRGTLLQTDDGGVTWREQTAPTNLALLDVAITADAAVAVGQMGLVLARDADGDWTQREVEAEERFLAVDVNAGGLAAAVGGFGQLRLSEDGGASWRRPDVAFSSFVEEGYDPHLYAVDVLPSGRIVVAGEFGLVVVSDDRGESWRAVRSGDESISALHFREDGVGYAAGQNGLVLRSPDSGDTWVRVDPGLGGNLLGIASTADGTVIVPGMRNMLISTDDGASFRALDAVDVNANWYQRAGVGGAGLFVVGHSGRVLRLQGD
jgi:photosystem II stability/assembly factor-like uncharacterized protein